MKIAHLLVSGSAFLVFAAGALADTLVLKNGDRVTGTMESSDAKQITFKTDFEGEIKVQWSAVQQVSSDKPV
jgi:hypothetical protein